MRISDAARALASPPPPPPDGAPASGEAEAIKAAADAVENDPFLQLVKAMVEMLTGQTIKVFSAQEFSRDLGVRTQEAAQATAAANPNRRAGFGIEYDFHSVYEEAEVTRLSAQGTVRTADGAEISFSLDLTMRRSYR